MIGQRVRLNTNDGPIKIGTEGVVIRRSPSWENEIPKAGIVWDVEFPEYPNWAVYQSWLDLIDDTPEEYEGWFV